MIHHFNGSMVDLAPDIMLFYSSRNDFKKNFTPQEIAQNILKLAEDVSDGGQRDALVSEIINRGDDFNVNMQKVNDVLSEVRTRKNVKYIDNRNIGLGI